MRRKALSLAWSTRWFNVSADRLGFIVAFGTPIAIPMFEELTYHPHAIGVRKSLSGWRLIRK